MPSVLRKAALRLLFRFGRDITIRHHYTGRPVRLHSFKHKGYWWYGRRREQETMYLLMKLIRSDDVVIEAGGHIGYVTLLLASLAKRVHVFEPDPSNLPYLRKNTDGVPNVFVHAEGLSDRVGTASFYSDPLTGQNSSFVKDFGIYAANAKKSIQRAETTEIRVPTTTLDQFIQQRQERIAFVKIDVEGFEETVLRGGARFIGDQHPMMIVEVNRGSAPSTLRYLQALGYVTRDVAKLLPIEADEDRTQNVLCIHQDDHAGLSRLSGRAQASNRAPLSVA